LQQIDILSVEKVRSPYLLLENSALSGGDHQQKEKLVVSVAVLIVVGHQASGQTLKTHCAWECRPSKY